MRPAIGKNHGRSGANYTSKREQTAEIIYGSRRRSEAHCTLLRGVTTSGVPVVHTV